MLQYNKHLDRQYRDRTVYWKSRAASRLRSLSGGIGFQTICCIIDGMDKSKFRFPRTLYMQSKELHGMTRPSLEMVGSLVHGHCLILTISDPRVHKDSSAICDILSHTLNRLALSGVDLRRAEFLLQADNTSREVKNNSVIRLMSALVGAKRLGRCEVRFLQSGHSHEDIDGLFSVISSSLEASNELHLPHHFCDKLRHFLRQPQARHVVNKVGFFLIFFLLPIKMRDNRNYILSRSADIINSSFLLPVW